MRITRVHSQLLRLPLNRPITAPGGSGARLDHVFVLLVRLDTDAGLAGLGFAYALEGGGRALKAIADDDLAPLLLDEDPLDHERLWARTYWRLQAVGRRGLVMQAYSAVDLALWDLKGKAANLPLFKLLGGARSSVPCYGADTGWLWMSEEEILKSSRPYIEQGMGIKVKIGRPNPEDDAALLEALRRELGDDVWLAVDANQRYDFDTALRMGVFLDDEISPQWFEEPLSCEDVEGHRRLAARLQVPLALGETLFGLDEFTRYLERDAASWLQPDVTRLGGITPWLEAAALAQQHHRPVAPHLLPEVGVHLACGLPHVACVEYMPWLYPLFVDPPRPAQGRLTPPPRPGLGLEVDAAAAARYAVG
jgi:L-alanine-DL-glutamate epimerase-like enolase superfamily enzyme